MMNRSTTGLCAKHVSALTALAVPPPCAATRRRAVHRRAGTRSQVFFCIFVSNLHHGTTVPGETDKSCCKAAHCLIETLKLLVSACHAPFHGTVKTWSPSTEPGSSDAPRVPSCAGATPLPPRHALTSPLPHCRLAAVSPQPKRPRVRRQCRFRVHARQKRLAAWPAAPPLAGGRPQGLGAARC